MAKNYKQSTLDALNKYSEKQLQASQPKELRAPNEAPEKEVEKECVAWMKAQGWSVQIYDSKAQWSSNAGAWIQKGMNAGHADCAGNTAEGLSVFVEFKAKGRLGTFNKETNFRQKKFITDKINSNCFAVVVDSLERLQIIYHRWNLLNSDKNAAKNYLLSMLPQPSKENKLKDEKLFPDE